MLARHRSNRRSAFLHSPVSRLAALAIALLVAAARLDGQAGTGTITGLVTAREGQLPLAHGIVTLRPIGFEQFTDEAGRFALTAIPDGTYELLVRRLGFAPVTLPVTVAGGATTPVTVELDRLAVRLATMRVVPRRDCREPGPPSVAGDSSFAAIFEQMGLIAAQLRLLSDTYPYVTTIERGFGERDRDGVRHDGRIDTLLNRSDRRWRYRRGKVVETERGWRGREEVLRIPTLLDFAEGEFQRSHCFRYGGIDTADGHPVIRIEFEAADAIRDPDIDGAIYLDSATYQIRRSEVSLTRIPRGIRGLAGVHLVTRFGELVAGLPIIVGVDAENVFTATRPPAAVAATETQRLLAVQFLGRAPPGVVASQGTP